jgi:hypothetical protein
MAVVGLSFGLSTISSATISNNGSSFLPSPFGRPRRRGGDELVMCINPSLELEVRLSPQTLTSTAVFSSEMK